MPTIVRFADCRITMYAADHSPPHFHVVGRTGWEVKIAIGSMKRIEGKARSAWYAGAVAWAKDNQALLLAKWNELNP